MVKRCDNDNVELGEQVINYDFYSETGRMFILASAHPTPQGLVGHRSQNAPTQPTLIHL